METKLVSLLVFFGAAEATTTPMRVLVTGAGGRTGAIAFEKLANRPGFSPYGLVRSDKAVKRLRKAGASKEQIIRSDIKSADALAKSMTELKIDALLICTSAVPIIKKRSLVTLLIGKLLRRPGGRPEFRFSKEGTPEEVDYFGTVAQVDAAKQAGVQHCVIVSSMGGTDRANFLNTIGVQPDGTGGEILLWKRKAERYLVASGLPYTIVHPGGLIDEEGGKRSIVAGINDELLKRKTRSIPRADVAEVCVQALTVLDARNTAFDIISDPPGEGTPTSDYAAFFRAIKAGPAYDYAIDPGEPVAKFPQGPAWQK
jgi:uncharacterized protein YbjT (DUF2867 family)